MSTEDPDRMKDLLRAADPARSLPRLRSDQLARLTEDAMTHDTQTTPASTASTASTAPSRAPRARRGWVLAGAGAAAVAAFAVAVPLALGPGAAPVALTLPTDAGGPAAMCAEVTPQAIAASDVAFRAEVVSIADGTVTLRVSDDLHGDVGDTVTVAQGGDTVVDGAPIVFEDGGTYLLAATDGMIATCGISGLDTPELTALYDEAFPG